MSQVVIDGEVKHISRGELVEIDGLAAKLDCSREQAAVKFFAPKKRATKKPARKRATKKKEG